MVTEQLELMQMMQQSYIKIFRPEKWERNRDTDLQQRDSADEKRDAEMQQITRTVRSNILEDYTLLLHNTLTELCDTQLTYYYVQRG